MVVPLLQRTLGKPLVVLLVDHGPADHSIARNRQLARRHDGQRRSTLIASRSIRNEPCVLPAVSLNWELLRPRAEPDERSRWC